MSIILNLDENGKNINESISEHGIRFIFDRGLNEYGRYGINHLYLGLDESVSVADNLSSTIIIVSVDDFVGVGEYIDYSLEKLVSDQILMSGNIGYSLEKLISDSVGVSEVLGTTIKDLFSDSVDVIDDDYTVLIIAVNDSFNVSELDNTKYEVLLEEDVVLNELHNVQFLLISYRKLEGETDESIGKNGSSNEDVNLSGYIDEEDNP